MTLVAPDRSPDWTLYCLAGQVIFKTASAGDQWTPRGDGLNAAISNLAVNPSRPQVLLAAGSYFSGHALDIFKSVDGGQSWSPRNVFFGPADGLFGFIWDEGRPNRVFLISGFTLHVSLDEGETWARIEVVPSSIPNGELEAIAVDKESGLVYAVADNGGLYRSDDPLARWTLISSPFVDTSVSGILTRPEHPGTLYAATSQGFMVSRDGGLTWVVSGSGLPQGSITERSITSLMLDPVDPDVLYAVPYFGSSIFRSTDDGHSWSLFLSSSFSIRFLAVTSRGTFFAGTSLGCFRASPGEADWTPVNTGLPGWEARSVAIDAFSSAEIYAVSQASVYFSEDTGRSWSVKNPAPLALEGAFTISADPSRPRVAYLGTGGCSPPRPNSICFGSLFKTTDGGSSWRRLVVPGGPGSVLAIAVDPAQPEVLYTTGYISGSSGVGFRSRDGGETWTPFGRGFPPSVASGILIDARAPGTILVATAASGVFRSADEGDTWQPTGLATGAIKALAQDPHSGYVYAGSDSGLFASGDGGLTWTLRASVPIETLAADPRSGSIYAAVSGGGIQVTSDGGSTWSPVGHGFLDVAHGFFPTRVNDLAVSSDGFALYAATSVGVYSFRLRNPMRIQSR